MTQKEINKASEDFSEREYEIGDIDKGPLYKGFYHGAIWRVNSVWHDAREQPKCDTFFIYENVIRAFHVDVVFPPEDEVFVWEDYVKDWGLIRWAYIEDLLPIKED